VPYEVNFTDEFGTWWDDLTTEQQEDVAARVELLEQHGPLLGRPVVDRVTASSFHNMKELRCSSDGALRALFAFDPRREARRGTGKPGTAKPSRQPTSSTPTT
jgi:hypothetical protein